jgi:hypothetical protein
MTSEERYRVAPPVIHQTIDGEVILVHLGRGTYHSLRGSGAALFDSLVRGASAADLAGALSAGTDGDGPAVAAAVARFLEDLRRDGLIVAEPDGAPANGGAAGAPPAAKRPFEEPRVETYTDLQDLLLTDPIHDVEPPGWPNVAPRDGKAGP